MRWRFVEQNANIVTTWSETMIVYSQVVNNEAAEVAAATGLPDGTQPPPGQVVATAVPFEQPNPADEKVLRSMALYLSGVQMISTAPALGVG